MTNSAGDFYMNNFSHIYVESAALAYPMAEKVLSRFPGAVRIEIERYTEVFSRSKQHFAAQKRSPKLILAVKREPFLYPGAEVCHDFGHTHFYYTSSALNCVYNCEYCFLQGMFPSAYLVLFVNQDDYFRAVEDMLRKHPLYLSISYETDLLAMERIAPFASQWITFAGKQPGLLLELRTKSANYSAIRNIPPAGNVILAWTLSPEPVISRHEPLTPPLSARLKSIREALDDGWKVRICFDPLLHIDNWRNIYGDLVNQTFAEIPADKITDISIGVFRIPKDYLKNMRKQRTDSPLVHYPYVSKEGVMSYPQEIGQQLVSFVYGAVRRHVPPEKIFTE